MKIGTIVKTHKMKDWAIVRAIDHGKVLLECNNKDDGRFVISVSQGITSVDCRRRLVWVRTKDLIVHK